MNDCELLGRHCELAVSRSKKRQKSAVRPDGGVVTQRTANPQSSSRLADKFATYPLCSLHGFPWGSAGIANFRSPALLISAAPGVQSERGLTNTNGEVRYG